MNARTSLVPRRRMGRLLPLLILAAVALVGGAAWMAPQPALGADPSRSNEGEVQFTLTPRGVAGGRFRVDIVVTTHSGDLASLDLKAATELRVAGQTLRPVKAPALRGHHASGRLEFALDRLPATFEIVIRGVRTMGELTFRWP